VSLTTLDITLRTNDLLLLHCSLSFLLFLFPLLPSKYMSGPFIGFGSPFVIPVFGGGSSSPPAPQLPPNTPVYGEIPPNTPYSHVIVGTGDYYIPFTRPFFNYGAIILIMFIVVILLAILVFALIRQRNVTFIPPGLHSNNLTLTPLVPTTQTTQGATPSGVYSQPGDGSFFQDATTCNANSTSMWNAPLTQCDCIPPFWGNQCQFEAYNSTYISSGSIASPEDATVDVIEQTEISRLSWPIPPASIPPAPTCTSLCDSVPTCNGVIWIPTPDSDPVTSLSSCTLFSSITVQPMHQLAFDPTIQSQIYVKTPTSIIYTDRVFIYQSSLPTRYWLTPSITTINKLNGGNYLNAGANIRYIIDWFPINTVPTPLTGVYSLMVFDPSQYDELVAGGDTATVYIHLPNTPLMVPASWAGQNIWLLYR